MFNNHQHSVAWKRAALHVDWDVGASERLERQVQLRIDAAKPVALADLIS